MCGSQSRLNNGLAVTLTERSAMGQAKLRGDFEQRKAEGIVKRELAEKLKRERMAEREFITTPKQRVNRRTLALIMAYAGMTANV